MYLISHIPFTVAFSLNLWKDLSTPCIDQTRKYVTASEVELVVIFITNLVAKQRDKERINRSKVITGTYLPARENNSGTETRQRKHKSWMSFNTKLKTLTPLQLFSFPFHKIVRLQSKMKCFLLLLSAFFYCLSWPRCVRWL